MERWLLTLVVIVFWTALYVFVPVLSPYAKSMGAGLELIGLVVGSYGLTQFLLRIPTGWLSDRLGRRKPFIALGFSITAASCVVMAWAPSPWFLVLGRGLSGVAATMWVPLSVMLASAFPPERAVAAMGIANFATNIGQIIGQMGGGWVAERWGWGAPFLVASGVAVLGTLLVLPLREQRAAVGGTGISLEAMGEVIANRPLLVVAGFGALVQYMTYVTVFGFTPVYAELIGASRVHLGWLAVATTVPSALAALMAARVSNRFGPQAALAGGFLLTAATTAIIPFTGTLPLLFATQIIGGFGRGLVFPLLMGLSIQAVPAPRRAMAMGVFQSIYALGMFGGPVIAGSIGKVTDIRGVFLSTALVGLIAVAGLYYERSREQHAAQS